MEEASSIDVRPPNRVTSDPQILAAICAFPLATAWYCEGCKVVHNMPQCPYCLSTANVHHLELWLNKQKSSGGLSEEESILDEFLKS